MSNEDAANCLLFLHQLQRHLGAVADVQEAVGPVPVEGLEQCLRRVSRALDRTKAWRRHKELQRARRRMVERMEEASLASSTLSESSEQSESEEEEEEEESMPIAMPMIPKEERKERTENGKEKERFRRVQETDFADARLSDNSFTGQPGSYGARASQDLLPTKGKGFTKEKNKKKRGSYRGGAIDFGSNSFKFE